MILEIHEITPKILKQDLSDPEIEILTFDDGLYSQFLNFKHFLQFKKPMYFFISPGIVSDRFQNPNQIPCWKAHEIFFKTNSKEYYMSWKNILEISKYAEIGGHSFNHESLNKLKLVQQMKEAKFQVDNMMREFKNHNIQINSFAFPYDEEIFAYKYLLKKYNVTKFFGSERIQIEKYFGL